tara:strand:- start:5517 stop:5849 length:333 start_codon:yes stop_codon:yes gene_type:complete
MTKRKNEPKPPPHLYQHGYVRGLSLPPDPRPGATKRKNKKELKKLKETYDRIGAELKAHDEATVKKQMAKDEAEEKARQKKNAEEAKKKPKKKPAPKRRGVSINRRKPRR